MQEGGLLRSNPLGAHDSSLKCLRGCVHHSRDALAVGMQEGGLLRSNPLGAHDSSLICLRGCVHYSRDALAVGMQEGGLLPAYVVEAGNESEQTCFLGRMHSLQETGWCAQRGVGGGFALICWDALGSL